MIDKIVSSMAVALDGIADGSVVLLGGFGAVGQANALVEGLITQGARDLTVVANNAGSGGDRAGAPDCGRTRAPHHLQLPTRGAGASVFEDFYKAGKIELEIVPQGTLAERLRAAGAGIPAFYTPTSVARSSQTARKRGRSTAAFMCWNMRYRATSPSSNPGKPTVGAT